MSDESTPASTDDILDLMIGVVKRKSHKLITRDTARTLYEELILKIVEETRTHGYFRLPYGYGQFKLSVLGLTAKPRRLPTGQVVARKPKAVLRFQQGATIAALLAGREPGAYKRRGPKTEKQLDNLKKSPSRLATGTGSAGR